VSNHPSRGALSRRQRQARQACVAVLSGLTLFVLIQLGLAVGLENGLKKVRDPLYGCRLDRVRRRFRTGPVKPWTVLMLGSSRTQFAFRVGKGDEKAWAEKLGHPVAAFNFGVAGGGSLTELLTWGRLRRDGVRPNLLLVEVLPPLLAAQLPPQDYCEVFLPTDRLTWQDLALVERYAGNARIGLRRDWLESWSMAWYAHRLSLISLVRPDLLPLAYRLAGDEALDESGAPRFVEAPVTPEQRLRATQRAREEYRPRFTGFHLGGAQCEALRELLASCRKEGVSVALVLMPEGPTFRSWYLPETWQAVQEWLTQISREYNAPLVNAREWSDDEDDFMDSHHLIPSGQAKFKERLARECIFPLLRRTQDKEPYAARLP
jgi:hypothetical protein